MSDIHFDGILPGNYIKFRLRNNSIWGKVLAWDASGLRIELANDLMEYDPRTPSGLRSVEGFYRGTILSLSADTEILKFEASPA